MDTQFRSLHLGFVSRTTAVVALSLPLFFSFNAWSQTSTPAASSDAPKQEFYSAQDRQLAIKQASIFKAKSVGEADIMAGPKQKKDLFQFHFKDKVTCEFEEPGSKMGGNTPKFLCKIIKVESADGTVQTATPDMNDEPVKVKFGSDNREVYAEIASSRLLWALGFYTDAWFPIQVACTNCPSNPEAGTGAVGLQSYPQASIVRKFDGHKMYEMGKDAEGWSWKELQDVNGQPSYQKDGLRLMAAFISHSDNKPPQQRLVCHGVKVDTSTNPYKTTCKESDMVVQDVGATWGGGGLFTSNSTAKANLGKWSNKPVWNKGGVRADKLKPNQQPPECQAKLTKSLTAKDGLDNPTISEEGRRFTAGLLCQLSDQQITDLFKAARFAEMPENHGQSEDKVVQEWVAAFKQKREDIAGARCRWHNQPADLAVIDNPAGLPTVTNNCTASPH